MKLINGQMYPRLPNTSSGIKLWQGQIYESVFQIQPSIEDDLDIFLKETFIIDEKSIYDYLNLLELRELPLEFKLKELSLGFVLETIPLDYRLKEKELKYKLTELPLEFKLKEVMKKA